MKWTGFIFIFLTAVLADKERAKDQQPDQVDQITDTFIKVLEKRLDEWDNKRDALEDISEECVFALNNGSIIRTHDSIEAGATFIKSPVVESRAGCQEVCCDIANCNLAVYKDKQKEPNACYLFDCGSPSICLFTTHPGFVAMELPRRETSNKQQAKHEQALKNLVTTSTTTATELLTTPTTASTTTPTTTTEIHQPAQPEELDILEELLNYVETFADNIGLFGQCESHKDCAGSYTECLAGYCVCQESYHAQDGVCRKDKPKPSHKKPVSHGDDGSDGSKNISPQQTHEAETPAPMPAKVNKLPSENVEPDMKPPSPPKHDQLEPKVQPTPSEQTRPTVDMSDNSEKSLSEESHESQSKEDAISSSEQDLATEDKQEEEPNKESSPAVKNPPVDDKALPMAPADDNAPNVKIEETQDAEVADDMQSERITDSATYVAMQKNQGAVIALALGLCVTALLLIFVGCRLRNVKRRLRKGRPMNSNEADYLINGMYL